MVIDGRDATVVRLTATAAGGCVAPPPSLDDGSSALFALPLVEAREPGHAADVAVLDHPATQAVTVIVTASADAGALDRFGPLARRLIRSLMFDRPRPVTDALAASASPRSIRPSYSARPTIAPWQPSSRTARCRRARRSRPRR